MDNNDLLLVDKLYVMYIYYINFSSKFDIISEYIIGVYVIIIILLLYKM